MEYKNIIFTIKDNIAWVKFNRPKKLNAMNAQVIGELERAVSECAENDDVRVVILTHLFDKTAKECIFMPIFMALRKKTLIK